MGERRHEGGRGTGGGGVRVLWLRSDDLAQMVKITVNQAALLQSSLPEWQVTGRKTAPYR